MTNYLYNLAKRRPDLFTDKDRNKILADDLFKAYIADLTKREQAAVIAERSGAAFGAKNKLLNAGPPLK